MTVNRCLDYAPLIYLKRRSGSWYALVASTVQAMGERQCSD
jgi:hypothetical protein